MKFEKLPEVLLIEIALYLYLNDLLEFVRVSKYFRTLLYSTDKIFYNLINAQKNSKENSRDTVPPEMIPFIPRLRTQADDLGFFAQFPETAILMTKIAAILIYPSRKQYLEYIDWSRIVWIEIDDTPGAPMTFLDKLTRLRYAKLPTTEIALPDNFCQQLIVFEGIPNSLRIEPFHRIQILCAHFDRTFFLLHDIDLTKLSSLRIFSYYGPIAFTTIFLPDSIQEVWVYRNNRLSICSQFEIIPEKASLLEEPPETAELPGKTVFPGKAVFPGKTVFPGKAVSQLKFSGLTVISIPYTITHLGYFYLGQYDIIKDKSKVYKIEPRFRQECYYV